MSTTVAMRETIRVIGGTLTRLDRPGTPPFEIRSEPTIVGRAKGCGLPLEDSKVSAAHFEVQATPRGVRIRDQGSRNGTFVDGDECVEQYLLKPRRIQCGDTVFQFSPGTPVELEAGKADFCGTLYGSTDGMRELFHRIRKVAQTDLTALITGETGTGKELVARAIHMASARARGPFVVFDCSAVPPTLVASELFGHERGAFSGAVERRESPFIEARGGTIFLDEIGELPIDVQPMLLRAAQEKEIKPVGSNAYRKVDVRIVAATRRDLGREINKGAFRDDLYFRLAQFRLELPPLRERLQDIQGLVAHIGKDLGHPDADQRLSVEALERLTGHDWPGNVRELRNVIQVALAFAGSTGRIEVDEHMSPQSRRVNATRSTVNFNTAKAEAEARFERAYWKDMCVVCDGNQSEMSRLSGLGRALVRKYLATYDLLGKVNPD